MILSAVINNDLSVTYTTQYELGKSLVMAAKCLHNQRSNRLVNNLNMKQDRTVSFVRGALVDMVLVKELLLFQEIL